MKAALFVAVLALGLTAAGCGSTASPVARPNVKAVAPSPMEKEWMGNIGLTLSTPSDNTEEAVERLRAIEEAADISGVQLVRVKVLGPSPWATSLVLAVSRPAYFLRHELEPILPLLQKESGDANYLRIVDGSGTRILESYTGRTSDKSTGGAIYVVPGLELCGPIHILGLPIGTPDCPAD